MPVLPARLEPFSDHFAPRPWAAWQPLTDHRVVHVNLPYAPYALDSAVADRIFLALNPADPPRSDEFLCSRRRADLGRASEATIP